VNILIVDDEPIIRIGLRTLVDWERHGFHLAGEASDGQEALIMLSETDVDILITDIRMPNIDGLELIRRAKAQSEELGVLVLSCLDEFEYVKEAMKLGSSDYILKPTMEPDDLLGILQTMRSEIEEERKTKEQISLWQQQLERSRPFQLTARVRHYIENHIEDDSLEVDLFAAKGALYSIMVYWSSSVPVTIGEWEYDEETVGVKLQHNKMFLLYACEIDNSEHNQYVQSYNKASELDQLLISKLDKSKADWFICVGPQLRKLQDIKQALAQHERQIYQQFYNSGKMRIISDDYKEIEQSTELPYDHRNDLLRSISNYNIDGILYHTEEIGSKLKSIKPQLNKLHGFIFEWLGLAVAHARQQGYVRLDEYEQRYVSMEIIQQFINIDKLCIWLMETMRELWSCRWGADSRTISTNPFIRKALEYMRDNYHRNIGAVDIADHVKLSRSYLSDLYSKEVGESLIETLTAIRMNMAKIKLSSGEMKIYEVAEAVGFSDPKSFAKTFKRIVGCSPKEYDMQNK
jgi:two-component system response regulator YesN